MATAWQRHGSFMTPSSRHVSQIEIHGDAARARKWCADIIRAGAGYARGKRMKHAEEARCS